MNTSAAQPENPRRVATFNRADGRGLIMVPLDSISSWEKDPEGFGSIVWLVDGKTKYHVTASIREIKKLFTP